MQVDLAIRSWVMGTIWLSQHGKFSDHYNYLPFLSHLKSNQNWKKIYINVALINGWKISQKRPERIVSFIYKQILICEKKKTIKWLFFHFLFVIFYVKKKEKNWWRIKQIVQNFCFMKTGNNFKTLYFILFLSKSQLLILFYEFIQ